MPILLRLLVFVCLLFSLKNVGAQNSYYKSEPFSFVSNCNGIVLQGTLTIPRLFKPNDKVVVLVSAPQPTQRDYGGMFSSLADTLSKRGIGVLRFDNCAFSDSSLIKDATTVHTQAGDALNAIKALRADSRFVKSPIGLLGHSEGGSAIAIAAKNNNDVAFVICLAPPGINGGELTYYQMTQAINNTFFSTPLKQKKIVFDIWRENIKIIETFTKKDSIVYYLDKSLTYRYNSLDSKWFGSQTLDEAIAHNRKTWLTPRQVAYIRFNPEFYYTKIYCPVLTMYGKLDKRLDYKANFNGLKKILSQHGKADYRLLSLDSLDHSFKLPGVREKEHSSSDGKFSAHAWGIIVNWVCDLKI